VAVRRRCALEAPDVRSHQTGSDLTALAASNSDVHDRTAAAYVPLSFAPGEAYQFDWSHEVVLLSRVTVIVKAPMSGSVTAACTFLGRSSSQ
jgi:hypothetical protein